MEMEELIANMSMCKDTAHFRELHKDLPDGYHAFLVVLHDLEKNEFAFQTAYIRSYDSGKNTSCVIGHHFHFDEDPIVRYAKLPDLKLENLNG